MVLVYGRKAAVSAEWRRRASAAGHDEASVSGVEEQARMNTAIKPNLVARRPLPARRLDRPQTQGGAWRFGVSFQDRECIRASSPAVHDRMGPRGRPEHSWARMRDPRPVREARDGASCPGAPAVDDPEMRFTVLSAQRELHLVRHLDG